jgi:membrane protease YdiL (CAAX protease family)
MSAVSRLRNRTWLNSFHLAPTSSIMPHATPPNSRAALLERRAAGRLAWSGPALMLFARSAFAVAAQGLVAAIYAIHGSSNPWRDAEAWLPVYGTLIDAGCLGALWWLARREGIRLRDLPGFDRKRLGRDILLGLALIPPSLLLILGGNALSSLLVYGSPHAPDIFVPLPLWAALYAALIFPLVWGIVEQTTYNGYALPRLQVLSRSTPLAVAAVAFFWSAQHAVMPLTFDPDFMLYRLLSPIAFSTFITLVYLRVRRIVPLATAHWLMDGADAFMRILWPLLR